MSGGSGVLARARGRANPHVYRLLAALYRRAFPSRVRGREIVPADVRRVLVVRHDRLGDMIVTLPLLDFLFRTLPHAEVDVLVSPMNASALDGEPRIANRIVNDHRRRGWLGLVRALRARRYDVIYSPIFGRGLREGLLAASVAHPHTFRVSVSRAPQYAGFFTHLVPAPAGARHMVERLLALGTTTLGVDGGQRPRPRLRLAIPAASEARAEALLKARNVSDFVFVNLWAVEPWRAWPLAAAAPAVDAILARHPELQVVLVPPPGSEAEGAAAGARFGRRAVVVPYSASIVDVAAIIRRARVVVTPDTAVVHLSSATGRPVVALYTARTVDPEPWLPYEVPFRALVTPNGADISTFDPADVYDAFESLLRELGRAAGAGDAERPPAGPR